MAECGSRERRTVTVDLLCWGVFNEVPNTLIGVIQLFTELLDSVPENLREEVWFEFGDDGDYESPRPALQVFYLRPETDEEWHARVARQDADHAARTRQEEAQERRALAALKAKYEGKA